MPNAPLLLYTHPDSGELFSRRWRLFVVDGTDRGATADIDDTPALIGAAPASSLVLSDDTVSRYHAEIDVFAEGLRVRDLDSTNGTFAAPESGEESDERIRDAFIENGGAFRVGRTTIRLIAVDEPAASEIETDPHMAPPGAVEHFGPLVGVSAATREIFRVVRKVAPSSSAVLLEGEVGTGKAHLAYELHRRSTRREQPYITLDLTTTPPDELSNALFGETNGNAPRLGLFERANHGTLFIEHIEELPPALQPRMRSVIERGELRRNGDKRTRRIDVRCLTSTTERLQKTSFDPGLYRRISVVRLKVPPLRARLDDAAAIVNHILKRDRNADLSIGPKTRGLLDTQRFDKNTKDVARLASRLVALEPMRLEGFDGLFVAAFLQDVLAEERGRVSRAARLCGIKDREMFRLLNAYGIELDEL
ncbi:MAG: sigma 54-interacting transcriptional regulator [Deltaproteobacteria bacterium]